MAQLPSTRSTVDGEVFRGMVIRSIEMVRHRGESVVEKGEDVGVEARDVGRC
jgi:hypothetical protein